MTSKRLPTPATAQELFRLSDNGAGGFLQTTKRRIKFTVRYWLTRQQLQRIRKFLESMGLSPLVQSDARMALRPMRPYLTNNWSREQRACGLVDHLHWLSNTFPLADIQHFYAVGTKQLFELEVPEGKIHFVLLPGSALGREGEMELHLRINDTTVMRTAFVVINGKLIGLPDHGCSLVVGNIQGRANVAEAIKTVTHRMERTRPHNLMHTALQALISAWRLQGLLGVSDSHHVYARYKSLSQRVGQSYDAVWQDLGATTRPVPSHWQLPAEWVPRDESEVASSKRSQLRRKNAIRQKVFDDIVANAKSLIG